MKPTIFGNLRILDFTQAVSGPFCTSLFSDLGADVVKVESPGHGDMLRLTAPKRNGVSSFFVALNRNKRSLELDLKTAEGRETIRRLLPHFDVIVENFRPGVMASLELDYESVKCIAPRIIYASISGYGQNNSSSRRAAYDLIMQCETGLVSTNGFPDSGTPARVPLSVSDYVAGLYCAFGIAGALVHRMKTGEGQCIDVAMYDSLISIMDNTFMLRQMEGTVLSHMGNRHPATSPHGIYRTADGFVSHISLTQKMWETLLNIMGRPELGADPRFATINARILHWREVDQLIEDWTSSRPSAEVVETFNRHGLPCGLCRTIETAMENPHNTERGVFTKVDDPLAGEVLVPSLPIRFSRTPAETPRPSPRLGEHTEDVLVTLAHPWGLERKKQA